MKKTVRELRLEAIASIKPMEIEVPKGFPAPLRSQCYLEVVNNNLGETTTEAGIIIPGGVQKNTIIPCVGIVMALGPDAPEYLQIGHRVLYPNWIEEAILFKGKRYIRVNSELDIFGIISEEAFIHDGNKSDAHIRREERNESQQRLLKHHEDIQES
jgi:co-chaperonin GroES (HSP10)